MEKHKFWSTQPIQDTTKKNKILNTEENIIDTDVIEDYTTLSERFTKELNSLPENFTWANINPNSNEDIDLLYNFLYENYNQKNDNFGLNYSKESLKWYISNPLYHKDMFIFVKYKDKICASIIGIPVKISMYNKIYDMNDISFLCIDKKIREKSLASIIIKEIARRACFNNRVSQFYTSPLNLPNKLTMSTTYHRPLNIKKLIDINFLPKSNSISFKSYEKLYKTKDNTTTNIRKLTLNDVDKCIEKYNEHYNKYKIYQVFDKNEFIYEFINNFIDTYVLEKNGFIECFVSIFYIKSRIFNNDKYKEYDIAQIYHYFYDDVNTFTEFLGDILCLMKKKNIDVVNWVEQMDNHLVFDKLKFCKGSGEIYYYFWNRKCPNITNKDIGLVTL
jgi:glycylpeptide N-tetradecanoyltransferase